MNTPTHTAAPWTSRTTDLGDGALWITGEPAANKYAQLIAVVAQGNPEYEANARLIAAAPDMLEALQDLIEAYGCECLATEPSPHCFMCHGRAAIAKATNAPVFSKGTRVSITTDVHWTDGANIERITPGPSTGTITAVDPRPTTTIYEIILDNDAGYFLYDPKADGPVVKPLS